MVSHISYYFGLFKKFQVLNHVPSNSVHGAAVPAGNFNLKNPHAPFEACGQCSTRARRAMPGFHR